MQYSVRMSVHLYVHLALVRAARQMYRLLSTQVLGPPRARRHFALWPCCATSPCGRASHPTHTLSQHRTNRQSRPKRPSLRMACYPTRSETRTWAWEAALLCSVVGPGLRHCMYLPDDAIDLGPRQGSPAIAASQHLAAATLSSGRGTSVERRRLFLTRCWIAAISATPPEPWANPSLPVRITLS
jgi:hypothetical protein